MKRRPIARYVGLAAAVLAGLALVSTAVAVPYVPGGTLDPRTIPKWQTELVIPPVMPTTGTANTYDISVRQFQQQILPAGMPSTTVWSYGPAADPVPALAPQPLNAPVPSSFNYPAFTIESTSNVPVTVRWRNELVELDPATGMPCDGIACQPNYLPHLFPVDQTLHWANPPATGCVDPATGFVDQVNPNRTDCVTLDPVPYTGPVPMVTHLHGAHVDAHSDGYPEAWWLPAAANMPAGYVTSGSIFGDATGTNPGNLGWADYAYRNDQPATTLWYHDHTLGMTRLNVMAGPAGFWLVRGGAQGADAVIDGTTLQPAVLPGPAPVAGQDPNFDPLVRIGIREVPIVIQDRSFNTDGSLFYPENRAFFDGYYGPYTPNNSDISFLWNPEAFFNTMVVNGNTWPRFRVAPAKYRLRLLNGCNSRFLNLSLQVVRSANPALVGTEIPIYQIGGDQGFLPQVVQIQTGFATPLPGDGTIPAPVAAPAVEQALLMAPAERADIIVDFTGLSTGDAVRMINTAPDAPFGGFPDVPAHTYTTGRVMQFVIGERRLQASDALTTPPENLVLSTEAAIGPADNTRQLSLNEMESDQVCVRITPRGLIRVLFSTFPHDPNFAASCAALGGVPQAPRQALLGTFDPVAAATTPLTWMEAITENPTLNATEEWELYNLTEDAHPIHLHLTRFQVINREAFDPLTLALSGVLTAPEPGETGYKDTVIAYPGEVTRVRALFDVQGLYVWHCHILEHEDNEMMRPYYVGDPCTSPVPVAGAVCP